MLKVSPIPRFELSILKDTEKQKHTQDTGYNVNTGQLTDKIKYTILLD